MYIAPLFIRAEALLFSRWLGQDLLGQQEGRSERPTKDDMIVPGAPEAAEEKTDGKKKNRRKTDR